MEKNSKWGAASSGITSQLSLLLTAMCVRRAFRYSPGSIFLILEPLTYDLVLSPPMDSRVVSAQNLGDLQLIVPDEFVCELAICFPFTSKIMLNMLCYMHFCTVNSLILNYPPWFTTKWSLMGGCHLWGKKRRKSQIFVSRRGCGYLRNSSSGWLQETFWSSIWLRNKMGIYKVVAYGRWLLTRNGYGRNDCIKGQWNKARKKEMGVFVIGYWQLVTCSVPNSTSQGLNWVAIFTSSSAWFFKTPISILICTFRCDWSYVLKLESSVTPLQLQF